MKNIFLSVIRKGGFDLTAMLKHIDEYHIAGKLTDEERDEVLAEARGKATPGMNVSTEIQQLWAAIHKIQNMLDAPAGGSGDEDIPEYTQPTGAHDAYFAGATVRYNGVTYKCIAPAGVACVWSPDVMPSYWEAA